MKNTWFQWFFLEASAPQKKKQKKNSLILYPALALMKMNAFVLRLIWGFQWGRTELQSLINRQATAPRGQPICCLSTPVAGLWTDDRGDDVRDGTGEPQAARLTSCMPIICEHSDGSGWCLKMQTVLMQRHRALLRVINRVVVCEVQCFYAVLSFLSCCCTASFPFNFRYFLCRRGK